MVIKKGVRAIRKNTHKKEGRRAVSPIVSTILLIMIVIVAAIIILLLVRSFSKEIVMKEVAGSKKTVDKFCSEVDLKAIINPDGSYGASNEGNVPVAKLVLKLSKSGNEISQHVETRINPGESAMIDSTTADGDSNNWESIKIIPVLRGTVKSSGLIEDYECPETNAVIIK
jgi:flagellin-like protein